MVYLFMVSRLGGRPQKGEESPSSIGQDAGEIPGGEILRKVPQKLHRRRADQIWRG